MKEAKYGRVINIISTSVKIPLNPDEYWARFIGRFSGWSRCIDAAKSYGG